MPRLSELFLRSSFRAGADRSLELGDSGGGDTTPGTDLVFGTDIVLLNGWDAVPAPGDGDHPGRIYQQGGRAWMTGWLVRGSDLDICILPPEFLPELFGVPEADFNISFKVPGNNDPSAFLFFRAGDWTLSSGSSNPTPGDYMSLDGVSWALAPS